MEGKKINSQNLVNVLSFFTVILELVKVVFEIKTAGKLLDIISSVVVIILIIILYIIIYKNNQSDYDGNEEGESEELNDKYRQLENKCNELESRCAELDELKEKNIELTHYVENFSLKGRSFVSTVQYIMDSVERTDFNNVTLKNVEITYELKDGTVDGNHLDMDIVYNFYGKNKTDSEIRNLILKTAIDFHDNRKYITASARDCREEGNKKFRPESTYDEETNIITWDMPFERAPLLRNGSFQYELSLDWKNFFEKENITHILIDPKNYSVNVDEISIVFINHSQVNIKDIHVFEFIRKPLDNKRGALRMRFEGGNWKITLSSDEDVVYVLFIISE